MQYSCAYFERPDMTLEEAQLAKKRHIAAKLQHQARPDVLDIGSGWGGLGLYLAATSTSTCSASRCRPSSTPSRPSAPRRRASTSRVHFELRDYRDLSERFDRIVSVGMFEHVGVNHYRTFFDKCATLLKPDGVMLLHSIGRFGPPCGHRRLHPQVHLPGRLHPGAVGGDAGDREVRADGRRHRDPAAALCRDAEGTGASASWPTATSAKAIYDERFCRMWEFYLAGSEAAFRWQDMMVFQMQLTRRNDTLPMTRDYMEKCEKALALHEMGTARRWQRPSRSRSARSRD